MIIKRGGFATLKFSLLNRNAFFIFPPKGTLSIHSQFSENLPFVQQLISGWFALHATIMNPNCYCLNNLELPAEFWWSSKVILCVSHISTSTFSLSLLCCQTSTILDFPSNSLGAYYFFWGCELLLISIPYLY